MHAPQTSAIFCDMCGPGQRTTPIAQFIGPTWGPSGADRTQVVPCWPNELCYLGMLLLLLLGIADIILKFDSTMKKIAI